MPVEHRLQPSFNNGEVSPLLYDRVDFQKFVSSVKSGKNMFVHAQGGMSNRAGTVMLAQAKDEKVLLVPFEFSSTETYVIEFGNGYCRFFTANGQVVETVEEGGETVQVPYEIVSPFTTNDLDKIRYCQSGDVMYIAWGGRPQILTRYGHTNWKFSNYDYKNGPLQLQTEYKGSLTKIASQGGGDYIFAGNGVAGYSYDLDSLDFVSDEDENKFSSILLVSSGYIFSTDSFSVDGRSWTSYPNNYQFNCIIKADNVFYALSGQNNVVYYFTTPTNISELNFQNQPFSRVKGNIGSFDYNNNKFYIIAYNQYNQLNIYSTSDFLSWSSFGAISSSYSNSKIIFHNNKIFFGGYCWDSSLNSVTFPSLPNNYYYDGNSLNVVEYNGVLYARGYVRNFSDGKGYWLLILDDVQNSFSVSSINNLGNIFCLSDGLYFSRANQNNCLCKYDESLDTIDTLYQNLSYVTRLYEYTVAPLSSGYLFSSSDFSFTENNFARFYNLSFKLNGASINDKISTGSGDSGRNGYSTVFLAYDSIVFETSGTWHGTIDIEYSEDNTNWSVYRSYSSNDDVNFNRTFSFDKIYFVRLHYVLGTGPIVFGYVFTVPQIKFVCSVFGKQFYSSSSIYVLPQDDNTILDFVLGSSVVDCSFFLFLWSNIDYYPTEVDLYQDRIVWTTNNQVDATKISDYTNFSVSTDVTEDDAISVIIKDKKIDKINSIVAGQKLAVFSDDGNFVHNNDTFTPQSATFLKQGATGGSDVKPVVVRDHIIYAHPMKQAVSDYAYNFETDGYAGQDITLLANHLFDGKVIKTLAYQQEPYSIIWVLLEDGTVLSCTYLRQQQVIAWTPMDFGGQVKSIAVCSTGTEEHLYLAVKRKNGTFVEKMPTRLLTSDPKECFFVDCGRTYRGEPATVISGLDYLEGEQVSVLADGNVVNGLTVENGSITIPVAASIVTVGLPYESVLETLTFDANMGDGTTLNRKKRVVALSVRYNQSRGSKVSVNGHREIDMLKREQESYNTPISLKSGVYREILPSTHNASTNVKIRQIDPLPITIVSVIPEIEYER